MIRFGCYGSLLLALATAGPALAQEAEPDSVRGIVEQFTAAYNQHDLDAMLALVHPDVQWLSISGDVVSVEAAGAAALREGMRQYFAAFPTSRSTVEAILVAGRFVSAWERAHWEDARGVRTQHALAVYEVEGARIRRVWYYPAQR